MRTATRSLIALLVVSSELVVVVVLAFVVRFLAPDLADCWEEPFESFWCRPDPWYMALALFCLTPVAGHSVARRLRRDAAECSRLLLVLGTILGATTGLVILRAVGYSNDVCGELPCSLPYELAGPLVAALAAGAGAFGGTFLGSTARRATQPVERFLERLRLLRSTSPEE